MTPYNISGRVIAMIVAATLLVGAIIFGASQCQKRRSAQTQSQVDRGQAGAARESAEDALGTAGNVSQNEAASEELGRTNEKEIRSAEGASDKVNAAVGDAGIRSLCRRRAYRNNPDCRLLFPDPSTLERGR